MATTTHDLDPIVRNGEAPSLADHAYVRLREEIISAEVAPGTLLREEELTARLGLGRTPVREAIQRLRREGYVTILPRAERWSREISITDLAAIYEVRLRLESWGARLAAERVRGSGPGRGRAAHRRSGGCPRRGLRGPAAHRPAHPPLRLPLREEPVPGRDARPLPQPLAADPARGDAALSGIDPRLDDVVHDQRCCWRPSGAETATRPSASPPPTSRRSSARSAS